MTPIEKLQAIHEIEQNLYQYARGVDRRDWPAVRSSYHVDGYDHHGSYEGGIDGLIQWMMARHQQIEYSIHLITNISVEFLTPRPCVEEPGSGSGANKTGDQAEAFVESYFTAYQRVILPDDQGGSVDNQSIGRYLDQVTLRADGWKVLKRTVVFDFYFTQPASDSARLPKGALRSLRNDEDPGISLRRALLGERK